MEVASASTVSQIASLYLGSGNNVVEPTSASIQQFEGLMQAPTPTDTVVLQDGMVPAATESTTIGDSILKSLEAMGNGMQVNADRLKFHLDQYGSVMDASSMMQVQLDVVMLGLQQDLTAKVADRASQGIQTLFRNQ